MSKSDVASDPVVTHTTVKRISRDVKCIMKNPLHENGIYYEHNMDNIFKGYAMIVGPTDTPYQDGFYFFEISFPYDYPHSPPTLTFLSNLRFSRKKSWWLSSAIPARPPATVAEGLGAAHFS